MTNEILAIDASVRNDYDTLKTFINKPLINWDYCLVAVTTDETKTGVEKAAQRKCAELCIEQGASPFWLLTSKDHPKRGTSEIPTKLNFMGKNITMKACDHHDKFLTSSLPQN